MSSINLSVLSQGGTPGQGGDIVPSSNPNPYSIYKNNSAFNGTNSTDFNPNNYKSTSAITPGWTINETATVTIHAKPDKKYHTDREIVKGIHTYIYIEPNKLTKQIYLFLFLFIYSKLQGKGIPLFVCQNKYQSRNFPNSSGKMPTNVMDISLLNTVLDISQANWGGTDRYSARTYTDKMKEYGIEQYAPVKETDKNKWIDTITNNNLKKTQRVGYSGYKFLGTFASHTETVSDNGLYNNRLNNSANAPMVMNVDVYVKFIEIISDFYL